VNRVWGRHLPLALATVRENGSSPCLCYALGLARWRQTLRSFSTAPSLVTKMLLS
jgi:hypothetical protein